MDVGEVDAQAIFMLHQSEQIIFNEKEIAKSVHLKYTKSMVPPGMNYSKINGKLVWHQLSIPGSHLYRTQTPVNGSIQFMDKNDAKETIHFQIKCIPMSGFFSSTSHLHISSNDPFWSSFCSSDNVKPINCESSPQQKVQIQQNVPICVRINPGITYWGINGLQTASILLYDNQDHTYQSCVVQTEYASSNPIKTEECVIIGLLLVIIALTTWITCIAVQLRDKNQKRHYQRQLQKPAVKRPPKLLVPFNTMATSLTFSQSQSTTTKHRSFETNIEISKPKQTQSHSNKFQNLMRGPCIGSGTFGKIYLSMDLNKGTILVVKQFHLTSLRYTKQSQFTESLEIFKTNLSNLLSKLKKHKGFVKIFGYNITNRKLGFFMPFFNKSSLQQLVTVNGGLDLNIALIFGRQILQTICFLHGNDLIHGGIKGSNILISENNEIKLTDIGLSQYLHTICTQIDYYSAMTWMAPEVINGAEPIKASDIWSFGQTLIELLTAKPLWSTTAPIEVMDKIIKLTACPIPQSESENENEFGELSNNNVCINDQKMLSILSKCLQPKSYQRFTATQLLEEWQKIFENCEKNDFDFSSIQESLDKIVANNQEMVTKFKVQYDMKSPIVRVEGGAANMDSSLAIFQNQQIVNQESFRTCN